MDRAPLGRSQAVQHQQATLAAQNAIQTLGRDARQGAAQLDLGAGRVPDLARVDIEAVVGDVGGQQLAVAIHQIGARQGVGAEPRTRRATRREQGRVGRAQGQTGEDGGKDRQDQEDADAGVFFRATIGAGALERVLHPPDAVGDPAPPGGEQTADRRALRARLRAARRRAAIIHAVVIMHAQCRLPSATGSAAGAAGATATGAGAAATTGGGAMAGRPASTA
ncbi:hypothetical protein D3C85_1113440 [compost metagenome]